MCSALYGKRAGEWADTTDSAYEFHLAKAAFCAGLDHRQVVSVIMTWRKTHGLSRSLMQLEKGIIPAEWLACRSFRCREGAKCYEDHGDDPGVYHCRGFAKNALLDRGRARHSRGARQDGSAASGETVQTPANEVRLHPRMTAWGHLSVSLLPSSGSQYSPRPTVTES